MGLMYSVAFVDEGREAVFSNVCTRHLFPITIKQGELYESYYLKLSQECQLIVVYQIAF